MIPVAYIAKKVAGNKPDGNGSHTRQGKTADIQKTAAWLGLGALGLGITFLVGRRIVRNIRKKNSERKFTGEAQQAILIRSSINPSGVSWMMWMDGTKEEAIYKIASQVTNFRKVQQEYQNLFNSSLVGDLEKELSTDEYARFMNIINTSGSQGQVSDGNPGSGDYSQFETNTGEITGKVILVTKATKVYEKFTWYPLGSVKKIEPYYFINHVATGNIKKLMTGYGYTLEFVETRIKTVEGSVKTIYVSKADVMLVSKEDFQDKYRNNYTKIIFRDSDF